jgi:hypothetical protein
MYRYAIIDTKNVVENIISWDGETPHEVPAGWQKVRITDDIVYYADTKHAVDLGDTYVNGKFVQTIPTVIDVETTVVQPTLAELQAQLLTITQHIASLANTANT